LPTAYEKEPAASSWPGRALEERGKGRGQVRGDLAHHDHPVSRSNGGVSQLLAQKDEGWLRGVGHLNTAGSVVWRSATRTRCGPGASTRTALAADRPQKKPKARCNQHGGELDGEGGAGVSPKGTKGQRPRPQPGERKRGGGAYFETIISLDLAAADRSRSGRRVWRGMTVSVEDRGGGAQGS